MAKEKAPVEKSITTHKVVEIAKVEITKEDIKKFLCPLATEKELYLAMGIINSLNLNPFKREVHLIKYTENSPISIVVGYEVYLKRAERTKRLSGWKAWIEAEKKEAHITIWRRDWDHPFEWYIKLDEFNKKQSTWNQIPDFMGKKVVIAQGFRMAFPDELGGMPYTKEEYEVYEITPADGPGKGKPEVESPEAASEADAQAEKTYFTVSDLSVAKVGDKFDKVKGTLIGTTKRKKDQKTVTDFIVGSDSCAVMISVFGEWIGDVKDHEEIEFKDVTARDKEGNIRFDAKTVGKPHTDEPKEIAETGTEPTGNSIPKIEGKVTKIEPHKYKSGKYKTDYTVLTDDGQSLIISEWREPSTEIAIDTPIVATNIKVGDYQGKPQYTAEKIEIDIPFGE